MTDLVGRLRQIRGMQFTPIENELVGEAADRIERLEAALGMAYKRWMISCHPDNDFADWPDDAASVMNDLWKEGWPEQAKNALRYQEEVTP